MEAEGGRNQTTILLEKIRRALGRLSVQTKVRSVELSRLSPPPQLQSLSVRAGHRPIPGAHEDTVNSPAVTVRNLCGPEAVIAGGLASPGSADSLFDCRVSGDLADLIAASPARVGDSLVADPNIMTSALIVSGLAGKTVRTAEITPYGGKAMAQPGFLLPREVETSQMPIPRIGISGSGAAGKRANGQEAQPNGIPSIPSPRVARVSQAVAERIPLDRRRLPMPATGSLEWQAAYLQERQLLAHTAGAGVSFTDIELVGVYRNVPITAARRLEIEKDTNALLLYLRPQVALSGDGGQKPVVSIAIGRVRSDGRLVRAVIR